METSETKAELFKAFANFKKKLKQPLKDADNPFFKSKYVPLENVVQVVDEAMIDTGLSYIQEIEDLGEGYLRVQLTRQISWLEDKKSDVWTDIIAQKIINQANHLSQLTFDDTASAIHVLLDALEPFDPSNREGHSARIYFNKLFGNDFTRDANNDINAGLDYGYTLLMSVFAREIVKMGCMTQLGLKHSNQFNDFNLASDIMEPFRIIVDQIVYGHRNKKFGEIRRELFEMFATKYVYGRQEMFLTNIASDYTKRVIAMMNGESDKIPVFRI